MPLMTIRAYARHRGVHHTSVLAAIRSGRITQRADGKIDSAQADRQWELRTDPTKPRNSVTGEPKHRRRPGAPPTPIGSHAAGNGSERGPTEHLLSNYAAARALRETFLARKAKLDYEVAAGKKIDADEVRAAAYNSSSRAKDLLLAIPDRVAPILAGLTDAEEVHRELMKQIRPVCEELMRSAALVAKGATS